MLTYFQPLALALLRFFTASLVLQHAARKLFGMFGGEPAPILSHLWLLGTLELNAGLLIAIGFLTRPAAAFIAIDMLLVYVINYSARGFPPIGTNLGEQFVLLGFVAAYLATAGPGRFSVEHDYRDRHSGMRMPGSAEWLQRYSPGMLGIARIVTGVLFAFHGFGKLGIGSGQMAPFLSQTWVAGVIEVFGGAAIAAGLLTRTIAFLASGEMAYAYFLSHAPRGASPIVNGGDRSTTFCFFFLLLVTMGPGRWALGALLRRKRSG